MAMRNSRVFIISIAVCLLILASVIALRIAFHGNRPIFNGERAYQDVLTQMSFGPRTPGSEAHSRTIDWLRHGLEKSGWTTDIQSVEVMGHPVQNIIAYRTEEPAQIILGAHYDSRLIADQGTGPAGLEPVPGANDGASGVAVLLELARSLPSSTLPLQLVFFDAEDNGGLPGWDWLLGSRAFVASLSSKPRAAIIVDMVGDADLNIFVERNSDPQLVNQIWSQAASLGYQVQFDSRPKYSMLDDHTPFLEAGIPAVDIIDFDYPYWHTSEDTADKVSAQSLQIVGQTLWSWIVAQQR